MRWLAFAFLVCGNVFAVDRLPSNVIPERYDLTIASDLPGARFSGKETIEARVSTATREITLHAIDLEIGGARIVSSAGTQPAEVRFDRAQQTMRLLVAQPISGKISIQLEWKGALNRKMAGFFWMEQDGKRYAFTQFEPVDARRMFPCFDEPALKARFRMTAIVDSDLLAVSNGAVVSEKLDGKKKTVVFSETAPMSSYLVALGVGPLAELRGEAKTENGTIPLRVIAPKEQIELGHFALETATRLMPRFESYFGIPYPFGKLDLVALPESFGGAMENTGAIFFRSIYLLVDPATASTTMKQWVAMTITHEMAHQWFGDLVTMRWWDDLWLNEAFATWAEMRFGDQMWPEWNLWTDFHNWLGKALALDQMTSTHAIRTPISSPAEANEAFDMITYAKGAAVLRMLEMWLGEPVFRRGVSAYLKAHQLGNTVADDLWAALAKESKQPVGEIARAWTDQPGLPLVTVNAKCVAGNTELSVRQERFLVSRGSSAEKWPIPLCTRGKDRVCDLVREPKTTLKRSGCEPLIANAGETGYYRVRYDDATLAALTRRHAQLTAGERIGLLRDSWALVKQGSLPLGRFLDLVVALRGEQAPAAVMEVVSALQFLDDYIVVEPARPKLRALVAQLFQPLFDELGWVPRPGESDEKKILRGQLLYVLGHTARVQSLMKEVEARLANYLKDPSSLDGSVADWVVRLAGQAGDAARWDEFHARARGAKNPEVSLRFRYALTMFEDPKLIQRTLQLSIADETSPEDVTSLLAGEIVNPRGRDAAWKFARDHFSEVRRRAPQFGFSNLIMATGRMCDEKSAKEVETFFSENKVEAAEKKVAAAVSSIKLCSELKKRESVNLSHWLQKQHDAL